MLSITWGSISESGEVLTRSSVRKFLVSARSDGDGKHREESYPKDFLETKSKS